MSAQNIDEKKSFHINRGKAHDTLRTLARQGDLQILYSDKLVRGVLTNKVKGKYQPTEALELLLKGSQLNIIQAKANGAYMVVFKLPQQSHEEDADISLPHFPKKQKNSINSILRKILLGSPNSREREIKARLDEIYELSPFVVDSILNNGYLATNTAAGTRLRTSLRDLGTSIQVITEDFLKNIGSFDILDLLVYTTNTEIGGIDGNYSGNDASSPFVSSSNSRGNPQSSIRIRGLFRADYARDYYKTLIPFDRYNTSSIEINRGSNAVLFGLGSPAGIINATIDDTFFNDSGEIQLRFDHFGSARGSLNVNREIINHKLAIRVAYLNDHRKYHQKPSSQNSERFYGAIKWNLADHTVFKFNFEKGLILANRPDSMSPIEAISPWLLMGKRILDYSLATGIDHIGPSGMMVDKDGDGVLDPVFPEDIDADRIYDYLQYADGSFVNEGNWQWINNRIWAPTPSTLSGSDKMPLGGVYQPSIWSQGAVIYDNRYSNMIENSGFKAMGFSDENYSGDAFVSRGDGQGFRPRFVGVGNIRDFYKNWNAQGYTDLEGYNWGKYLLSGTTSIQQEEFDAYNFTLEQTFWDHKAGFQFSGDWQSFYYNWYAPLQNDSIGQIRIDMNVRLPDGRKNPNLGRPYMNSRNYRMYRENEMETLRATGFIQHDFAEQFVDGWLKWLGRHIITGTLDKNSDLRKEFRLWQVWDDVDFRRVLRVSDRANDLEHFSARVFPFVYVGPSVLDSSVNSLSDVIITPPDGLKLWNPGQSVPMTYWDPGSSSSGIAAKNPESVIANGKLVTRDIPITAAATEKAHLTETITESIALVHQGYFLHDHLVMTVGYRSDSVESKIYTQPPNDEFHRNQLDRPLKEWKLHTDKAQESRLSSGIVVHLPENWMNWRKTQLSFHYAESSNFSVEAGRVNWNNEHLANPRGKTKEWGFSLNSMNRQLYVRANWFETVLAGRTSSLAAGLLYNSTLGRVNTYLNGAADSASPLYADFHRAVAMTIWDNITVGEKEVFPPTFVFDEEGLPVALDFVALKQYVDTEDVISRGMEVEVTYSPTENWKLHLNIAKVETVLSNIHPHTLDQWTIRKELLQTPVQGFEWVTIGELSAENSSERDWIIDPETHTYVNRHDSLDTGYLSISQDFDERIATYWTKKASEGSIATEQRKWRVNLVTHFRFREGLLSGFSIGGAYRWQDNVAVGFPYYTDESGRTMGDVDHPVYAPSEDNTDVFFQYQMPYFRDIGEWNIKLHIKNVFADENDVIPVQLQGDGVSYSRVRLAPQRQFIFSSSFKF